MEVVAQSLQSSQCMSRDNCLHPHDLGQFSDHWTGWVINGDTLYSPAGEQITEGEARATKYRLALIQELQRRLEEPQQWRLL